MDAAFFEIDKHPDLSSGPLAGGDLLIPRPSCSPCSVLHFDLERVALDHPAIVDEYNCDFTLVTTYPPSEAGSSALSLTDSEKHSSSMSP